MLNIPISLLAAHFVGDFLLQSDWMAINKSKNWRALGWHAYVYSATIAGWTMLTYAPGDRPELQGLFWVLTILSHFITDAITSRITSKLWFFKSTGQFYNVSGTHMSAARHELFIPVGGSRHWFFVMIGFDQLIHAFTLALSLRILS